MACAVSSASPSKLSFEPVGEFGGSFASDYSTTSATDEQAQEGQDGDGEDNADEQASYQEPETRPPTLLDDLDAIRDSTAKAVAALKEASAQATVASEDGEFKPVEGELKALTTSYVSVVGVEIKHFEKLLADRKAAGVEEDALRDAYDAIRDFLVDVTGVLEKWEEDKDLGSDLPPFHNLLTTLTKELADLEIENTKAFDHFYCATRPWRMASQMEDLAILTKDDSYEGHEAALRKRFDILEDLGGRLVGGRPDLTTQAALDAIDYQPFDHLEKLVNDQLTTFLFLLQNTQDNGKLAELQERLVNFTAFETEIFEELLKAGPDFSTRLNSLKTQLSEGKADYVPALKAYLSEIEQA